MLAELGVDETCELVYRAALRRPVWSLEQLRAAVDQPAAKVDTAVQRLMEIGLLRRPHAEQIRPVNPAVGFASLLSYAEARLARQTRAVELTRAAVAEMSASFRASPALLHDVELLDDRDAAWLCVEEIAAKATTSIQCLAAAGGPPGLETSTDYDPAYRLAEFASARGIRVQLILLDSIVNDPRLAAGARRVHDNGVEVRTTPTLPVWTFVVDDRYVVIGIDPADNQRGVIRVSHPGLVAAAADLFGRHWLSAVPIELQATQPPGELTRQQRQLLQLLAMGAKDESIARQFSVSARTVRRMIADLTDRVGASSRFELGVRAVRLGWLDDTPQPAPGPEPFHS
ncbi:LuxR C-terminal-related transcriptional regulator [Micromonospora sp. NPDC049460]|uniref:LuxR C-terminal-related transcriptional regulator n=1 Tax=Micromonospora sp. NPDC049460 TaxID=3364272 RepID=UPI0037B09691